MLFCREINVTIYASVGVQFCDENCSGVNDKYKVSIFPPWPGIDQNWVQQKVNMIQNISIGLQFRSSFLSDTFDHLSKISTNFLHNI